MKDPRVRNVLRGILRDIGLLMPCVLAIASLTTMSKAQGCPSPNSNVATWHNDNDRTGWQCNETTLTPGSFNTGKFFGLLWQWPVAGRVYAQPLAVNNVPVSQICQQQNNCPDLVFIATEQDMLYAFAHNSNSPTPYWSRDLAGWVNGVAPDCATLPPSQFPVCADPPFTNRHVGVTGTPVIDVPNNTLYVVGAVEQPTGSGTISYFLFAVDIRSGSVMANTMIAGSVPGLAPAKYCKTTMPPQGDTIAFNNDHIQRSGLLLLGGVVYVAFAAGPSEFDNGWLFGYQVSGSSFNETAVYSTTANGTGGGIWGSGAGPASDGTSIYLATGNGTFDLDKGASYDVDAGDTLLKLNPSTFAVEDWYAPYDVLTYNNNKGLCAADEDFGSGGVLLVPDAFYHGMSLAINADKQSNIYVANTATGSMGHLNQTAVCPSNPSNNNNVQCIVEPLNSQGNRIDQDQGYWASPAYYKYSNNGTPNYMLYYSADAPTTTDLPLPLNGYNLLTSGGSGPIPTTLLTTTSLFCNFSPTPSVSSNGTTYETGIVWAIENQNSGNPTNCPTNGQGPAALHAFDATTLAELYNSGKSVFNTQIGKSDAFPVPIVFNGFVYMGTDTEVDVFGMCPVNGLSGCLN